MPIILKYIDIFLENNSSHINDTIQLIFLLNIIIQKTIFIQATLTMSIIVSASMAK